MIDWETMTTVAGGNNFVLGRNNTVESSNCLIISSDNHVFENDKWILGDYDKLIIDRLGIYMEMKKHETFTPVDLKDMPLSIRNLYKAHLATMEGEEL